MGDKTMNFTDYQKAAGFTAVYPNRGANLYYPALGLGGEAGEVLNKIKKIMRDRDGKPDTEDYIDIADELGDVLWYISATCDELNIPLDIVAERNIRKLKARHEKGTLQGKGSHR